MGILGDTGVRGKGSLHWAPSQENIVNHRHPPLPSAIRHRPSAAAIFPGAVIMRCLDPRPFDVSQPKLLRYLGEGVGP